MPAFLPYHLRAITKQQESLQEIKTSVVNQRSAAKRSAFINKEVIRQLNETIKFLEKKIAETEEKIITYLKSNKEIEA